jgi:hypothetical protein|tara:strand:- start:472 stop:720 length:249 start_codon:yes stop_codon:yes gene_type:complete
MSGTGITNFAFTEGNVLPNTMTTATSGGDNINVFKANFQPVQTGGKKHRKSYGKKRKSMRNLKKNKSKKNKSRKNTRRNRRK